MGSNHEQRQSTFSIITIVNKEKIYEDFKRSLESQKEVNYELVKIDNTHNQFFQLVKHTMML